MNGSKSLTRSEIASHNSAKSAWIIIDGNVYDVTEFARRHPGGDRILHLFAGQDASDAFHSFHIVPERPRAMMNKFLVGRVTDGAACATLDDFRALRAQLQSERMFDARPMFFLGWFCHIVALEVAAALVAHAGAGWPGFVLCAVLLGISQIQAGWLQHDFGHLAVFKSIWANDWAHNVTIMALKGASAQWWKTRHNRHHAKTNVLGADPDIDNDPLFLLGARMVDQRRGWRLSRHQHLYWYFLGPPLVTTLLFIYQNLKFVQRRRLHAEKLWIVGYFLRFALTFGTAYGVLGCIALYFSMRLIESNWFTWVTSMSHLPMQIDNDDASCNDDWISHTVKTTQNLSGGTFNDWFTGHLNYQVEHHLFPTMPRHNYPLVAPRVAALCAKHGLPLRTRTMWQAATDVVDALEASAKLIEKKAEEKRQQ
jgi:fatty acid desaturase/predicted heme/steroid binding protein